MQELDKRIQEFLDRKNIQHPFIRECVSDFIKEHDNEFGNIVSTDELFQRLEKNVDSISFIVDETKTASGEYIKRDKYGNLQNKILIYRDESVLNDINKTPYIKKILRDSIIHELTHAAYTKVKTSGIGEQHIFSETYVLQNGETKTLGKRYFIEGIVNFISTRISKIEKEDYAYVFETEAIQLLADKIGIEPIIKSAWHSDEEILKRAYIDEVEKENADKANSKIDGEKSYKSFCDDIFSISGINDKIHFRLEHLKDLLEGKTDLLYIETIKNSSKMDGTLQYGEIEKLKPLDLEEGKIALKDVEASSIISSLVTRATDYIRYVYNKITERFVGRGKDE